jgi:hypothetical protein
MNKYRKSELAEMQKRFAKSIWGHMQFMGTPLTDTSLTVYEVMGEALNTKAVLASAVMRQINYMDMRKISWCLL